MSQSESCHIDQNQTTPQNEGSHCEPCSPGADFSHYAGLTCCDPTRNVDVMWTQYQNDRASVLADLTADPSRLAQKLWSKASHLSIDRACLRQMGKSTVEKKLSHTFMCPQCKNISRLSPKFDATFTIECGTQAGKRLGITSTPVPVVGLITKKNNVISDEFTNQLLVTWSVDAALSEQKMKLCADLVTGFICHDHGYFIHEVPEIARFSGLQEPEYVEASPTVNSPTAKADLRLPLRSSIATSIITQLFSGLRALLPRQFSHGAPSVRALSFSKTPASYLYDGYHVRGPLTLKLGDFRDSSIQIPTTQGPIQLKSKSPTAERYRARLLMNPVETKTIIASGSHFKVFRLMPNQGRQLLASAGPASSALEAYAFMVGLMAEQPFHQAVVHNPELARWWHRMWLPQELPIIQDRVVGVHHRLDTSPLATASILDLLSGLHLRLDVIDHLWKLITDQK